ncbi:hypothetical protein ATY77_20340 [Rhizobium sp. R634]|uniref:hypothetical protein n=1 Tax=Rhizobium sp. R634 TaxID=1764274 RepID=UPI000B538AE3|nr:hypothetical protein [Rhizobium sp. R634]OWV69520.1 hypothetical protein ATY77_20340 [Rhizobium sp. R634]
MSKNETPPFITPLAVPERLRKDGWWLTEGAPAEKPSGNRLIMIEKRHLREEQQWTQPIP